MQIKAIALIPFVAGITALAAPASESWEATFYEDRSCSSSIYTFRGSHGKQYETNTEESVGSVSVSYDSGKEGYAAVYDMFTVEDEGVDGYNQVGADYGNACIPADPGYKILAFKTKGCKESDCNGPPEPDNE